MALALLHPASLYDIAREGLPLDERIVRLMAAITVEGDESLSAYYPSRWPATVVVDAGGAPIERTVLDAPGDPGRPFDDRALVDKAGRILDSLIGAEECRAWLDAASGCLDDGAGGRGWERLKTLMV
jgi:2-methylcitrate dehydratase PrpD